MSTSPESIGPEFAQIVTLSQSVTAEATKPLEQRIKEAVRGITTVLVLRDNREYIKAAEKRKWLLTLLKGPTEDKTSVTETFGPLKRMADKLHSEICAQEKKHAASIQAAVEILGSAILRFDAEQEAIRRKQEEEARRQREQDERIHNARHWFEQLLSFGLMPPTVNSVRVYNGEKLEPLESLLGKALGEITDTDVINLEGLVRQAAIKAEEAQAKREAEDAAEQARALGHPDVAEEILQGAANGAGIAVEPLPPPPPMPSMAPTIAESTVPKVAGTGKRENWLFRVKNPDLIPREYLMPDDPFNAASYPKLARVVRAMKSATNIPGIEAYAESSLIQRTR
jgi:hypothetical protein